MLNPATLGWTLFTLTAIAVLFLVAENKALRFEMGQKTAARDKRGRFQSKHGRAAGWRGL